MNSLVIMAAVIIWQGTLPQNSYTNYPDRTYRVVRTDITGSYKVVAEQKLINVDAMGIRSEIWINTEDSFRDADIYSQALQVKP